MCCAAISPLRQQLDGDPGSSKRAAARIDTWCLSQLLGEGPGEVAEGPVAGWRVTIEPASRRSAWAAARLAGTSSCPLPTGPITASRWGRRSFFHRASTSSSRPKKYSASSCWKAAEARIGSGRLVADGSKRDLFEGSGQGRGAREARASAPGGPPGR